MNDPAGDRRPSSLDDETPGSQGEIEAGSEGDFGGPEAPPDGQDEDEDEPEPAG